MFNRNSCTGTQSLNNVTLSDFVTCRKNSYNQSSDIFPITNTI